MANTASSIRRRRHEQAHNTAGAEVFNAQGLAPASESADLTVDETQNPEASVELVEGNVEQGQGDLVQEVDGLAPQELPAGEDSTQQPVDGELESDVEGERVGDYAENPGVDYEGSATPEQHVEPSSGETPPKSGAGSSTEAWFAYALTQGKTEQDLDGLGRDEIIALLEK